MILLVFRLAVATPLLGEVPGLHVQPIFYCEEKELEP